MTISEDGQFILCDAHMACDERIKNHRWGKTKATGWFFSRDETVALCPQHVPSWYSAWRLRKVKERKNDSMVDYHGPACGGDICLGKEPNG